MREVKRFDLEEKITKYSASLTNAFGYWQGQNIGNATSTFVDDILQAFGHVQNLAGSSPPELWVGETGWPTDGKFIVERKRENGSWPFRRRSQS